MALPFINNHVFAFLTNYPIRNLKYPLIFLIFIANEHVCMHLVSLNKNFSPHQFLRLGKIVCVLGISTTHSNWDNYCSYQDLINSKNPKEGYLKTRYM